MKLAEGAQAAGRTRTRASATVPGRIYLAIQRFRGEPLQDLLNELLHLERAGKERLQTHRRNLARTLLQAAAETPWYGSLTRGMNRSGEDPLALLSRLPLLTKSELRQDASRIRNPAFSGTVNAFHTTGSTGNPLMLVKDRVASAAGRAAQLRGRAWHGIPIGATEVRFGGISIERLGRLRARVVDRMMRRIRFAPYEISPLVMDGWVDAIRRIRPSMLYGYPSVLSRLAGYVLQRGLDVRVPIVVSSSERLFDWRRKTIAEAFRCPVVDEYGAAETSIIGFECEKGSMHAAEENLLVEVVDDDGRPVPDGEEGEFVVTDLRNVAMPLIRYRMGDRGRRLPEPCGCGRNLARIEILEGSRFGEVALPDGVAISGVVFHFALEPLLPKSNGGILDVRIVKRRDGLDLEVVRRGAPNEVLEEHMRCAVESAVQHRLPVRVVAVQSIDRGGSDKFKILFEEQ